MFARYNRTANERLYAACARLNDEEYRKQRRGSFGSIHGLLNHILLGDRRWMGLFENGERVTPPLNQILYGDFSPFRVRGHARTPESRGSFRISPSPFGVAHSSTRTIGAKSMLRRRTLPAAIFLITKRTTEGRFTLCCAKPRSPLPLSTYTASSIPSCLFASSG